MTLEERLAIISNKAEKDKVEEYNKKANLENATENALNKIKELTPRIKDLITLVNKCIDLGIDLPTPSETTKLGYGSGYRGHSFIADGIYHHVGFMDCEKGYWYRGESKYKKVEYLGIKNGGFCGAHDFYTNGTKTFYKHEITGEIVEAELRSIKNFLEEFDLFEAAFYKWIDSMEN